MPAINSPFRYEGGKFYAHKLIAEHLIDTDVYCEPFAGGASILLLLIYKYIHKIILPLSVACFQAYKVIDSIHNWRNK